MHRIRNEKEKAPYKEAGWRVVVKAYMLNGGNFGEHLQEMERFSALAGNGFLAKEEA